MNIFKSLKESLTNNKDELQKLDTNELYEMYNMLLSVDNLVLTMENEIFEEIRRRWHGQ